MKIMDWMEKHYIFTMAIVAFFLSMIAFTTIYTFVKTPDIPSSTVAALGLIWGVPVIGLITTLWKGILEGRKADDGRDSH